MPTDALRGDLAQLERHGLYVEAAWRALTSVWERSGPKLAEARQMVAKEGALHLISEGASEIAGAFLPALGITTRLIRWTAKQAKETKSRHGAVKSPTVVGVAEAPDIVEDVVDLLRRISGSGLPVVILVEDVHGADRLLLELLGNLLRCNTPIMAITTAWPDLVERNSALAGLMVVHEETGLLRRVGYEAPAGEGFPAGAGLTELESNARRQILRQMFPRVNETTEQELLERYVNPLALELLGNIPKYRKYRVGDEELDIAPDALDKLSRGVFELYREIWEGLPAGVRLALAVAHMICPANIDDDVAAGEDRWADATLREVVANLDLPDNDDVRNALDSAPDASTWVRVLDDYLLAFAEAPQKDIAGSEGSELLEEQIDDARTQILNALAHTLVDRGAVQSHTVNSARTILALHAEQYISAQDDVVGQAILLLLDDLSDKPRELPERLRLFEYFNSLDATGISTATALAIRDRGAAALGQAGQPAQALTTSRQLLGDRLLLLGPDHPDTLASRSTLAVWLGESGRVDEAITACRELLADQQRVLGTDHPNTLTSRNNLAVWLSNSGRIDEAITAYRELLADLQRVLGTDHPNTLNTRNNLALCLGDSGRSDEAITAYEGVVADQQRVLGPDHPNTLTARNNLALCLGNSGRVDEAVAVFEGVVADQQRVLGPDHPNTLNTRNNLALWLGNSGRIDEAITAYTGLLADQQRVLGPDHPNTLTVRHNLALWLGNSGRIDEAITAYTGLLADQQRVLGPDHPNTLTVRHNLADLLGESGQVDEAVTAYAGLLTDQQRVLGPDHPNTLNTRDALAFWLIESGRQERAGE
ncbi:MAG: tetratricopeptide repeat protein [bacterium]|nr:tetratricopeptide repeat protein [bacterium]